MTRQRLGRAIELRAETGMTYKRIGEKICCRPSTIYQALQRYDERGAVHIDMRSLNRFKNSPKQKITSELRAQLIDR